MHDQAIRMQRLVDDLLSLSKLELQEKNNLFERFGALIVIVLIQ